jgi:RNA polymerase sigma factor (sigma-70 family)
MCEYFHTRRFFVLEKRLAKLIEDVKDGNDSAFSEICEDFSPLMKSQVLKLFGDNLSEYDDRLQDAAMALYNAIISFDLTQDKVTFGLYAKICVKNRLRSFLRKYRRQAATATLRDVEPTRGAIEGADYSEQLQALRAQLSPFENTVLTHLLAGEKPAQISRSLCRPPKAVYNALVRIRRKRRGMTQM